MGEIAAARSPKRNFTRYTFFEFAFANVKSSEPWSNRRRASG